MWFALWCVMFLLFLSEIWSIFLRPARNLEEDLLDLSISVESEVSYNELTLVGYIIYDRTQNFKAVKSILYNSYNLGSNIHIASVDRNKFSCVFHKITDIDCIVNASPWAVKGHIIVFKHWTPSSIISKLDFTFSPFSVQIHNIPSNRQNLDNAKKLWAFIGSFMEFDNCQDLKNYLRVWVSVNILKPLKMGTFIKREDGSKFEFERLSDFCYQCGKLGHTQSSCSLDMPELEGVPDPRKAFGPWLRASPLPSKESLWPPQYKKPTAYTTLKTHIPVSDQT